MAKNTIVTCKYCGIQFDREQTEFTQVGNRYAHTACYNIKIETQKKEEQDYKDLVEYILKLFKIAEMPIKIERQIKDFINTYNYSYEGIRKTLEWWFDVKKNPISLAQGGIGIVPFVYHEGLEYYRRIATANEMSEDLEIKKPYIHEVVIEPPQAQKKIKLID